MQTKKTNKGVGKQTNETEGKGKQIENKDAYLANFINYMKNPYHPDFHAPILQAIKKSNFNQNLTPIQLKPVKVQVTGITHLVELSELNSLFLGKEGQEVDSNSMLTIETDDSIWSRRGPNQEIDKNRQQDATGITRYLWYGVKNIQGKKMYLRDETFRPLQDQSLFSDIHIDPARRTRNPNPDPANQTETQKLAKRQTKAARNLMYNPNETLNEQLRAAAITLIEKIENLGANNMEQEGELGKTKLQTALFGRILGKEGIMAKKQPEEVIAIIRKIAEKPAEANANERMLLIALMGDIGALYADTGATTGVENRSEEQAKTLRNSLLPEHMSGGQVKGNGQIDKIQKLAGSKVVGPKKKEERSRPWEELVRIMGTNKTKKLSLIPRTGIHNTGNEIDNELGIGLNHRIKPTKWQIAHMNKNRVNGMQEPLAGHMSGSPAEILQVWDALVGMPENEQYSLYDDKAKDGQAIDQQSQEYTAREARAAGASAFLIAGGYHSAVEVLEGTKTYMGENPRKGKDWDAGMDYGNGNATDYTEELHSKFTKK